MLRKIILTIIILFATSVLIAQEDGVVISEKKSGKRVVLFAENTTKDSLNVFFMVLSEGYRRSADRPVIKNIPPLSKIPMITLIELADIPSSYSYELVVNDKEYNLDVSIKKDVKDIEKLIEGKLVLFTIDDCDKCEQLSNTLNDRNIAHRTFNIHKDEELYRQFMAFIKKDHSEVMRIMFPVIWNKDHTIFGYKKLDEILIEIEK
ncbi:thioredoxin domain-containing protein [Ulvibacter antarcticus]|uniref:Glutaredoxin n=1 Tax=Ulvibacter antarcticus TaxID=442714 RepID=A0A3L9YG42_9FLAO|nr:glutaredoxin [Ulvibacter antarcticus]RMA58487.1 glutaredoxin [Ulvibacter antarcticus]